MLTFWKRFLFAENFVLKIASVTKAYRVATFCIHPDKVHQKGDTLQQKNIAEKGGDCTPRGIRSSSQESTASEESVVKSIIAEPSPST
ncbi:hypothetical protein RIF29_24956 [Crotalaria pallida]|uniref:Uncharacterized protein n=1 Tax=Crotalaria pallida TaxID=3830 RepID=A0AAN9EN55_CROPI